MTEQARPSRPFKQVVNKIDTLETPDVTRVKPARPSNVALDDEWLEGEESGEERSVLDKLIASGWFSLENVLWLGLIALTIFMHLVDLGPRAMHHDESIHASFSYDYFRGVNNTGAAYDPTWHGPLLYNLVALSYFLFGGVTETTARMAPAIFGIILVVICYFLRPVIGRIGALAMAIFMMFSPSMLYYGRSLRHDIFATVGELLFVIGFFRFIQNKPGFKSWWLPISGLGLVITYASHEMVFINTAILLAWLGLVFVFEVVSLPAWIKNRTAVERETWPQTAETEVEEDKTTPEHWESAEQELANEGLDQKHGRVGDPILGNWGYMGLALFALISLGAIWGSVYLFSAPAGLTPAQAFGLPQWLLTIPFGILMALLIGYSLGGFLAYGYSRLEEKNVRLARFVILGSLIVLGALGVFSALRNKAPSPELAAASAPVVNGSLVPSSDIYLLGMYELPRLAFNLMLVLVVSLLLGVIVAWFWQRRLLIYTSKGLYAAAVSFFAVMLVSSLVSLRFALADKTQAVPKGNLFLVGPEVDKWLAYVFNGFFLALVVGLIAGWLVSLADRIDDSELAGSAVLRGALRVSRQPMAFGGFVLVFGIIYILLFSTWFFNLPGLADGFYKGIEYWRSAQDIRRLDQPWFYYPMLTILYEILPLVFGFAALFTFPVIFVRRAIVRGRCRFTVKGVFIGYTLWWSIMATLAYSIAGEKAPWLNMQVVLPIALAASLFLDFYIRRIPWRNFWGWNKGPLFALLFVLTMGAIGVIIGLLINMPGGDSKLRTPQTIEAIIVAVIALALFAGCYWLWWTKRVDGKVARASIVMVFTVVLFAYTIKSTIALNYLHPDTATEPLIYVQTAPEIPLFVQRLDRLSRDMRDSNKYTPAPAGTTQADPSNSRGLPVLLSNEVAWPLQWYLRDYTDKNYFTPNNSNDSNPGVPSLTDGRGNNYVVIAMQTSENSTKIQQQLQDQYTPHTYKFRWWFPEDDSGYGGLGKDITKTDWSMIARSFTEQPYAGRLWRYIMYRELWNPLQAVEMVVYVRNDVDPNWGLYEANGQTSTGDQGQTQAANLFDANGAGTRNGQFKTPRDIAVAPNGDILVLDSENARVQRFDKDGKFLSKFGGVGKDDGKFALAQFNSGPSGIAVDEDGNIYVSDSWNYRIQKFDKDGKFLLKWGDGKDTTGDPVQNQQFPNYFYGPRQLAYDKDHKELYVADTGNKRILVFDKQGQFIRQFGSKGSAPGQFNEPVGVALSPDNSKVYVSDLRNKRVQVLDRNGQAITEIPVNWNDQQALSEPYLKTDIQGNLYVSDPGGAKVYKYNTGLTLINTYDASKGVNLSNPVGLAFDSQDNLLIADAKRNAVVKVTP